MSVWLKRSKKKPSGGKLKKFRKKKKKELGRVPSLTRIGEAKVKKIRTMGGNSKQRALMINSVNVYDPKKKINVKAVIEDVMKNPANRHYVRMDVITKGAVLKTDKGFVKVTNRPGQDGLVNAVFTEYVEEKGGTKTTRTVIKKKRKVHADRKEKKVKVEKKTLTKKMKEAMKTAKIKKQ